MKCFPSKKVLLLCLATINYSDRPDLLRVIEANSTRAYKYDAISGMAVFYNDVFIVYSSSPVVCIYDACTHRCKTQLTLEGFVCVVDFRDCVNVAGDIYIMNGITREILQIDPNRNFKKWSTGNDSSLLSVSAESTIVVTCSETRALREYSTQGKLIQEIKLCSKVLHPDHAIKLGNGHFVVSHRSCSDTDDVVFMVNNFGGITKSFWDDSRLIMLPTRLAVNENGDILLFRNVYGSEVVLLNPELEFKRQLVALRGDGLDRLDGPAAMHLDEKTGQLYIAGYCYREKFLGFNSRVVVLNIF